MGSDRNRFPRSPGKSTAGGTRARAWAPPYVITRKHGLLSFKYSLCKTLRASGTLKRVCPY